MEKEEKRILMLSLGKGKDDAKPYEKTTYLDKNGGIVESSYVAEPLIKLYEPDYVYVIGTCSSAWSAFYTFFREKANLSEKTDDVNTLTSIELGKYENKSHESTKDFEKQIENIYEPILKATFNIEKVRVVLLPVGKDDDELTEIYNKLFEEIEKELSDDYKYKVAFDITHSFRSLPFYNYAILSYFKEITKFDLEIDSIYYGMNEIKKDNDGIAPIVELNEVNSIMKLTSAVAEFKQTGSVKSLLSYLDHYKDEVPYIDELIVCLKKFDWAIGSNDGSAVTECLANINAIVKRKRTDDHNKYSDIIKVLKNALETEICEGIGGLLDISKTTDVLKYADNQLILSKWYLMQHRYSQAACVASESLRSYITPLYLKAKKQEIDIESCKNEDNRKDALGMGFLKLRNCGKGEVYENCLELINKYRSEDNAMDFNSVRNNCAHALDNGNSKNNVSMSSENLQIINDFISCLEKFAQMVRDESKAKLIVDMMKIKKIHNDNKNVSLFICNQLKKDAKNYLLKRDGDVYIVDSSIFSELNKMTSNQKLSTIKDTCFKLAKYIKNSFLDQLVTNNEFSIIISNSFGDRFKENLIFLLTALGIKTIYIYPNETATMEQAKKMIVNADLREFEEFEVKEVIKEPIKLDENTPFKKIIVNKGTYSTNGNINNTKQIPNKDVNAKKITVSNKPLSQEQEINNEQLKLKENVQNYMDENKIEDAIELIKAKYGRMPLYKYIIPKDFPKKKNLKNKFDMCAESLCFNEDSENIVDLVLNKKCEDFVKGFGHNMNEYTFSLNNSPKIRKITGKQGSEDLEKFLKKAALYRIIDDQNYRSKMTDDDLKNCIKALFV